MLITPDALDAAASAYAFIGNSLLRPMSQTGATGLDPEFWAFFDVFDDPAVTAAAVSLRTYALEAQTAENPVQRVSVEFTRLFIGPPKPAAAPWESYYEDPDRTYGFGHATSVMRAELRAHGLELTGENHQFEDHMGIELLLLSELCRQAASGECSADELAAYQQARPASWVAAFRERVEQAAPNGYFARLLALAETLLTLS